MTSMKLKWNLSNYNDSDHVIYHAKHIFMCELFCYLFQLVLVEICPQHIQMMYLAHLYLVAKAMKDLGHSRSPLQALCMPFHQQNIKKHLRHAHK